MVAMFTITATEVMLLLVVVAAEVTLLERFITRVSNRQMEIVWCAMFRLALEYT
jgi:hypothetical protein